ncbi:olfactory receptor 10AG1-like [Trichosurus vulpecula]|uniref:olfactory receptor 10AG1-like n=1 Tax=Trichosurus vulpecula TaxID=9337 RepID=UPI00186ACA28|nr:olfactory receptor 10AG1-like [Trichosurus vulpecula]
MEGTNVTLMVEFILLGFSDLPNLQRFLFGIFLVVYLSILLGNGLIIMITKTDVSLQTPMYYFLGNFSFLEMCYASVTVPRMLTDLWTHNGNISLWACATQLCFFLVLGVTECFLLAVMAYDRYVAICKPLYYFLIMKHDVCIRLVVCSWIVGIPVVIGLTYQIFSMPFCDSTKLNNIFCDIYPVLQVACGDTSINKLSVNADVILFGMIPFILILNSYIRIITTIMKLPSATGRSKAFSTCSSHLIVISLFFVTAIMTHLQTKASHSAITERVLSLLYTTMTPLVNPIIYSLRNKDVIVALRKLLPT